MRPRHPSTPLRGQGYVNRNSTPASFNFAFSSPSPEFHSPPFGPQGNYLSPPDRQPVGHWQQWPPFVPSPERSYARTPLVPPSWNVNSPPASGPTGLYRPNCGTAAQFNSPTQNPPVIRYPPPFQSPRANFPNTPPSNRTFYMSAASTASNCGSISGQSNVSDTSQVHSTKREVLNWKQRCTTDPWTGILPKATPGSGDRLVTSAFNQRHTVLFAPHSRISGETILQS